jgi:cell division protein FtsW (lipid II flippase)
VTSLRTSNELLTPEERTNRRGELGLLLLVDLLIAALYALASLGAKGHIPASLIGVLIAIMAMSVGGHFALRRLAPRSNQLLLPLASLLNGIGYVEIARWNPVRAQNQAVWSFLAMAGLIGTLYFVKRSRDLDRYRYITLLTAIVLMVLPLIPGVGISVNGARLWIGLGSYTFQPIEISKILLALFFASYFASNKELLANSTRVIGGRSFIDPRILLPIVVTWGIALVVLGAENDIGFASLLFALFLSLLWITTGRIGYVLTGLGLLVAGGFVASQLFYQVNQRVAVWLDPWNTHAYEHGGRQIIQGLFSLSAGGLTGTGVGLGQAGRWVPEVTSDMIYTAIGEELGLVGLVLVLSAILLIIAQGFFIAQRSQNDFSRLVAVGLSAIIGFQAFFICAGILRVLPLTGITLPFVAYGGSSLLANYIILGLLLRISEENHRQAAGGFIRQMQMEN